VVWGDLKHTLEAETPLGIARHGAGKPQPGGGVGRIARDGLHKQLTSALPIACAQGCDAVVSGSGRDGNNGGT
jgi:hypothetical protein